MAADPVPDVHAVDAYLDAVARRQARAEEHGPLTLFVPEPGGWPLYARPRPGAGEPVTAAVVAAVRERQRALGLPEAFEWVEETAPAMAAAARDAGLAVVAHPLMALPERDLPAATLPSGFSIRLVTPADDLPLVDAVSRVAFAAPGTAAGETGTEALAEARGEPDPEALAWRRARHARGEIVTAVVTHDGTPVASGAHQPVGDATEVVGVATLPAFRRRGLGAAVTRFLVEDARRRGVRLVCLSAGDETIARVYGRLGFRRIGTAGGATPAVPTEGR